MDGDGIFIVYLYGIKRTVYLDWLCVVNTAGKRVLIRRTNTRCIPEEMQAEKAVAENMQVRGEHRYKRCGGRLGRPRKLGVISVLFRSRGDSWIVPRTRKSRHYGYDKGAPQGEALPVLIEDGL